MTGAPVRAQIEAALRRLAPDGEDARITACAAIFEIQYQVAHAAKLPARKTGRQAAGELKALADAIEQVYQASKLSLEATEQLDAAWKGDGHHSSPNLLPLLLDEKFAGLGEAARAAAMKAARAPASRGANRKNEFAHRIAHQCADAYLALTGREPTRAPNPHVDGSPDCSEFCQFLAEICGALRIGVKPESLAKAVIAERRQKSLATIHENSPT